MKKPIITPQIFIAIIVLIFMQINRDLLTHLSYNFELRPENIIVLFVLMIFIYSSSMFSIPLIRRGNQKNLFTGLLFLMILSRTGIQLTSNSNLDFLFGFVGAVAFWILLPLLIATFGIKHRFAIAVGFLLGVALDTGILGAFETLSPAWRNDWLSYLLAIAEIGILVYALRKLPEDISISCWKSKKNYFSLLAIGPIFFLNSMYFQNIGLISSATSFDMFSSLLLVSAGNILAFLLIYLLSSGRGKYFWVVLAMGGIELLYMVTANTGGGFPAWFFLLGQIYLGLSFYFVFPDQKKATEITNINPALVRWVAAGVLIYGIFMVLYYVNYLTPMPFTNSSVLMIVILCLVGPVTLGAYQDEQSDKRKMTQNLWGFLMIVISLISFPLLLRFSTTGTPEVAGSYAGSVRVMSYNLHNGFDIDGRLSIDQQIEIMRQSEADIIGLQEISRGWPINGSFDMLSYIQSELNFPYAVFMPLADAQWGIAVISRYPISEYEMVSVPTPESVMGRGFLWLSIDLGEENLDMIVTHLHHLMDEEASVIRVDQVSALLDYTFDHSTQLVLGDFNAEPGDPEMVLFIENGWIDGHEVAGEGEGLTFIYGEYVSPRRIDWILARPELNLSNMELIESEVSDHVSLIIDVSLP